MNAPTLTRFAGAWDWIARLTACAAFVFFMAFAFGGHEEIPVPWNQPLSVQLEFASLGLIFVGYAVGWRRPLIGGMTVLLGYACLNVVEFAVNGRLIGGMFWLFAVPGLLYLAAAWRGRRVALP